MEETKKLKKSKKRIIISALLIVLTLSAVLLFAFADKIFAQSQGEIADISEIPFSYESGTLQSFELAGDGLAVVSSSSAQLFDASGTSAAKRIVSFGSPAVSASRHGALFFDIGSRNCFIMNLNGEIKDLDVSGSIISANMNDSGYITVITEEAGYKALVSVYDSNLDELYRWYSGSGYAIKAVVAPDGRHFAVLSITAQGSEIHIFAFTSETERGRIKYDNLLLLDFYFMGNSQICAIGEGGFYFSNTKGEDVGSFGFGGMHICDYSFDSTDFAAVFLSAYRNGAGGKLLTVSAEGTRLGEIDIEKDVVSMSSIGRSLLVMSPAGLILYSRELNVQREVSTLMTSQSALLRPRGDVLLSSSFTSEIFKF